MYIKKRYTKLWPVAYPSHDNLALPNWRGWGTPPATNGTKHAKVQKTLTRAGPKNAPDIGNHHLPPRTVRASFPAYGSSFYFFLLLFQVFQTQSVINSVMNFSMADFAYRNLFPIHSFHYIRKSFRFSSQRSYMMHFHSRSRRAD